MRPWANYYRPAVLSGIGRLWQAIGLADISDVQKRAGNYLMHRVVVLRVIAFDRSRVPGLWIDAREVDLVACLFGKNFQKSALRAAVAIKEAVNGIQLADMLSRTCREVLGCEAAQIVLCIDCRKVRVHVARNVFCLTKWTRSPGIDRPVFPGP